MNIIDCKTIQKQTLKGVTQEHFVGKSLLLLLKEDNAANALQQHGVRVVVLCKFCKHFEGLRKEGWCNLHNCIRKLDSYCSYGERRK